MNTPAGNTPRSGQIVFLFYIIMNILINAAGLAVIVTSIYKIGAVLRTVTGFPFYLIQSTEFSKSSSHSGLAGSFIHLLSAINL
jgi:hypothetical protein